ncbi:MAG: hypothetical protein ACTSPI_00120 [Candidatus Heimdallarchaeaceae archaeon]
MNSALLLDKIKQSKEFLKKAQDEDMYGDYLPMQMGFNEDIYRYLMSLGYLPEGEIPEEYTEMPYSEMDQEGMQLGEGAAQTYGDIANLPNEKFSSEKVAELLNEVVKIGRAGAAIKKMDHKVAKELNMINKDYLVEVLSELFGE